MPAHRVAPHIARRMRQGVAAALLLGLTTVGAAGAAIAAEKDKKAAAGGGANVEVFKSGWWWAVNDTPLDQTAAAPTMPAPPNVPKTALPVAAVLGEPEKMSAIEFALPGDAGSTVTSAVLQVPESGDPGANLGADGAAVLACPMTEVFWAEGSAASWKTRPTFDCDAAKAVGERSAEGVWTFDLTGIATQWLAAANTDSTSIVLVEGADAPGSFQVSFDVPAAQFSLATTGGSGDGTDGAGKGNGDDDGTDGTGDTDGTGGTGTGGAGSTGGTGSSGGLGSDTGFTPVDAGSDTGSAPPADVPVADLPATTGAGDTGTDAPVAAGPDTLPVAAPAVVPPWYGGIPKGGLLLAPLALGLAYLAMLALGPDAQPAVASSTQHGVGRALERLRRANAAMGQLTQHTSKPRWMTRKGSN